VHHRTEDFDRPRHCRSEAERKLALRTLPPGAYSRSEWPFVPDQIR
jgi:hypothetical protein